MILESVYQPYFAALLAGNRAACAETVDSLLGRGIEPPVLYTDLFQRSLYAVGDLWETNRISVAVEHLATAITESLLPSVYPSVLSRRKRTGRKAVISCSVNEFHQVGARMAADILEMNGWDAWFLGANMPADALLAMIQERKPDLLGLSLSVYFNMASLNAAISIVRSHFPELDIAVGGQAFRWGGSDIGKKFPHVAYIPSIHDLAGLTGTRGTHE